MPALAILLVVAVPVAFLAYFFAYPLVSITIRGLTVDGRIARIGQRVDVATAVITVDDAPLGVIGIIYAAWENPSDMWPEGVRDLIDNEEAREFFEQPADTMSPRPVDEWSAYLTALRVLLPRHSLAVDLEGLAAGREQHHLGARPEDAVGDPVLGQVWHPHLATVGGEDLHPVGVHMEPGPRGGDVVGDDQVEPAVGVEVEPGSGNAPARVLEPALQLPEPIQLDCVQERLERLVAELAIYSLDVVAIPEFLYGAMENVGHITFRDNLLLMDPETRSIGQRRAT